MPHTAEYSCYRVLVKFQNLCLPYQAVHDMQCYFGLKAKQQQQANSSVQLQVHANLAGKTSWTWIHLTGPVSFGGALPSAAGLEC